MADYTTITNASLEVGEPVTTGLLTALRDNPTAITEGASGAPRVKTAALAAPTAGTSHLIMRLQEVNVSTSATTYPDSGYHNRYSHEQHLGVTVLVAGTITVYAEHRNPSISGARLRVLKNGTLVQEWTYSDVSNNHVARQVDVSVAVGDKIILQQANRSEGGTTAEWRNLAIYSGQPDMAVA